MTIQLGDNDRTDVDLFLESFGLRLASLPNGGIHHEDNVIRLHSRGHRQHLLEQRFLLLVPSTGIDNNKLESLFLKHVHAILGDDHRIHLRVASVERNSSLGGVLLDLIVRTGTERIRTNQTRLPVLLLIVIGQLGTGRGLSGSLEGEAFNLISNSRIR